MMNDEEDSDFKMDGKRSTVAVNASRHSAIRDEDSETDDQVGNGHQSEPDEDELGKLPADVRSSQEKENGQLGYSKRGRRLRRVSLNEEELFDEEFDEEDENVTVKRRRNSSSQRRRRFDFATKSESRDSSRTPKSPVYTRSGRLTRQNSRYDDDSNEDDIRGVDRERGALDAHLEEEEFDDEGSVRRSTRLRRADRSVYHDPSEEEVDVVPARKRPSAARKEGVAVKQEVETTRLHEDSSDEKSNARRSHRVRSNVARYTPIKEEESSPGKVTSRRRIRRVLSRDQRTLRRRSRSRGSKSQDKEEMAASSGGKRALRPRSSKRGSLREVPNSQIELRRRSRDSSDDAFSSPSSDEEESEITAHISAEEKYDLEKTAKEVGNLPPREVRTARAPTQIPANIAELARESRRGRPYRPRVRDVLLDHVKTGGEPKKPPIEPLKIDPSITWDTIGGLDSHVKALKEMVLLPLLYPEVFEKFKMEPPKGVLFYGPPGTGKTLCARALAASCGTIQSEDKAGNKTTTARVSFFMRNGADCLSKWVGEAERTLRQTFEVAKQHQPSIIFFDEIDGLAPVRSSRQDQIHSSIVSTLLGLMDGLEARGQIVVIGATNRVDSIDPALRRAGRFDRELIFKLPNLVARKTIMGIHTRKWDPKPSDTLLDDIAARTVGYCGADLKSLCSESALSALRRRYPQIYKSTEKLVIDAGQVHVKRIDYLRAMQAIVPASYRSTLVRARPLDARISPLLKDALAIAKTTLKDIFRQGISLSEGSKDKESGNDVQSDSDLDMYDDEDVESEAKNNGRMEMLDAIIRSMQPPTHRPRLLVYGKPGFGQEHIGPAVLHLLEGCPTFGIDLVSLYADPSAKSQEEALVTAFREAARAAPSVLYIPHMDVWWSTASESLRATLLLAMRDMPTLLPVLIFATAQEAAEELPEEIRNEFPEKVELQLPEKSQRRDLFEPLFGDVVMPARLLDPQARAQRQARRVEVLEKAPPPPPKKPVEEELVQKTKDDDRRMRNLRMEMRELLARLLNDRKYMIFWNPVDPEEASDYYDIIKKPVDLSMIAANVDAGRYSTVMHMVSDVDLMVRNAIEYNPPHTEQGARILRRAHALIDLVHCWADNLDVELVNACNEIVTRRAKEAELQEKQKKEAAEEKKNEKEGVKVEALIEAEGVTTTAQHTTIENGMKARAVAGVSNGVGVEKPVTDSPKDQPVKDSPANVPNTNRNSTPVSLVPMEGITTAVATQSAQRQANDARNTMERTKSVENIVTDEVTTKRSNRVAVAALCGEDSNTNYAPLQGYITPSVERLHQVRDKCVNATEKWNLDALEELYVKLGKIVYDNRSNNNRAAVLTTMEKSLFRNR